MVTWPYLLHTTRIFLPLSMLPKHELSTFRDFFPQARKHQADTRLPSPKAHSRFRPSCAEITSDLFLSCECAWWACCFDWHFLGLQGQPGVIVKVHPNWTVDVMWEATKREGNMYAYKDVYMRIMKVTAKHEGYSVVCKFMYLHMCTCVQGCIYTRIQTYTGTHAHMHTCTFRTQETPKKGTFKPVYMYVNVYVCMRTSKA